jgi:hypothetical protein
MVRVRKKTKKKVISREDQVLPKKRKSRRKCYDGDNPDHVCSPLHVRVPGHCRLKRFRRRTKQKENPALSSLPPPDAYTNEKHVQLMSNDIQANPI